ncbi:MAG: DUF1080 domain-containing protein [Acidobacteria bacterium]|nr:DUF1080 domain-containing protein [Acidobacteriota bacterium]
MNSTLPTRRSALAAFAGALAVRAADSDWVALFDGRTMNGWKANENASTWSVKNGCLSAAGPRSHLFYTGPVHGAKFKNFELEVELKSEFRCNSGVFIHTQFQDKGWPAQGFEIQVDNTALGEGSYVERKKTGSLYGVRNQYKSLAADNEWFKFNILVRGKNVQVRVNGVLTVDYTEPAEPLVSDEGRDRRLSAGTFALQGHDAGSKVMYRSVRVRPLPEDTPTPDTPPGATDATAMELLMAGAHNYPVVDYHAHLKEGLTLEEVLRRSRATGIYYGIAVNCGKGFPVQDEASARKFADSLRGMPVFCAMQAEGREWTEMFSRAAVGVFDYVFTDSMTWTDNHGRRMRTWIPAEVGTIADPQEFMDTLVARAVGILEHEPIDIYVNPTYVPDQLAKDYDKLWTDERIRKVVMAAKKSEVAIELNDRYKLPGLRVVQMAKEEGVKFTFGTNNAGPADLRRCEYGLEMVKAAKLRWQDFFVPRDKGDRAVDRKGGILRG